MSAELRTVRYHNGFHYCTAIMKRGRKNLLLVHIQDSGVVVKKEPLNHEKFLEPLLLKDKPYPMPRIVKHFRAFGRQRSITKTAIRIMREAVA